MLSAVVKKNFFFYIFQEISGSQTWLSIRIRGWGRGGSFFSMTDPWTGISKGGARQSIFWISSPVGFGYIWVILREGVRVPLKPKILVTPVQALLRWLSSCVLFSILLRRIESSQNQDGDDDDSHNCGSHGTRRGLVLLVLEWFQELCLSPWVWKAPRPHPVATSTIPTVPRFYSFSILQVSIILYVENWGANEVPIRHIWLLLFHVVCMMF